MREFWDRQPGESAKAYYAFTIYRDLGHERSIPKVVQKYAKTKLSSLMKRWSSKFLWVQRAAAYDDHIDALKQKEREKEAANMSGRHITLSMALQQKAAEKLKDFDGREMKVRDMIYAINVASRLERLARGDQKEVKELETIAQGPAPLPWEELPEARQAMKLIAEKLQKEKAAADEAET